jgi:hypothetical protein
MYNISELRKLHFQKTSKIYQIQMITTTTRQINLQKLSSSHNVPQPNIDQLTSDHFFSKKETRSAEKSSTRTLRITEHRVNEFLTHAPVYQVETSLESLLARGKNHKEDLEKLQVVCDKLVKNKNPQAFSAQFVDSNGVPLFNYMAYRWKPTNAS